MTFGSAFHKGVEAIHRGQDGDVAFVRAHASLQPRPVPGAEHGLALLRLYRERGVIPCEPEKKFRVYLPDRARCPLPILGFIDGLAEDHVVEVKTARGGWTEARAALEPQAALYAYAFKQLTGQRPTGVRYLIFSTTTPRLDEYFVTPGGDELRLFEHAAAGVYAGIVRGNFDPCGACWFCRPPSTAASADTPSMDWS